MARVSASCQLLAVDTGDLEEDAAGDTAHHSGEPLPRAHAGFRGSCSEGTVRVDVDPHLAATLDVTRHRDTSGLDLTVRHVSGGKALDAELAEGDAVRPLTVRCTLEGDACGT